MKIIIAGYGVEGRSNYAYFRQAYPQADMVIADAGHVDDAPVDAEVYTGSAVFSQLPDADMVVRTAGLPPRDIVTTGRVWSATNEFFARCPAPIIGVTGTKGKGTTCGFITEILRAAGRTVHLVGNIGVPALDVLERVQPNDIVVYELSSFQLWDLEKSPHVAVVLMIEPDHLDKHADFAEYVAAKARIVAAQHADDYVVYNKQNKYSRQIAAASAARKLAYPAELTAAMQRAIKVPGEHNLDNASAAVQAARAMLPELDEAAIVQGLAAFTGLPHRLKYVAEKAGVTFYDDSIATTPGSAIAAMRAFAQPKVIILGGYDKGADYGALAQELAQSASLRGVVLIGQNAPRLAAALSQAGVSDETISRQDAASMPQIVQATCAIAQAGDVVILSPAAASFGMFTSYADRGEQFVRAVEEL